MSYLRVTVFLGLGLLFSACSFIPPYQRPHIDLPEQISSDAKTNATYSLADKSWPEIFSDPALQALIKTALKNGPQALLALAQLSASEAQAGVSRSVLFPQLDASIETSPIERLPGNTFSSSFLASIGISWELDLWGQLRAANEAAKANILANRYAWHEIQTSLIAHVARAYYQLSSLNDTRLATISQIGNGQKTLALLQHQQTAGVATAIQVAQQTTQLASIQANLPAITQQIKNTQNLISLLLGKAPGKLKLTPKPLQTVALPVAIPVGLPSDLLEQRPDIQAAEANLIAANANIGRAKALFFPRITLTALFGGVSTQLSEAIQASKSVASLGPSISQALWAGNANVFNEKVAKAAFEQAVIQYQQSVLQALNDVANALAAYQSSQEMLEAQQRLLKAAQAAMDLSQLRFEQGIQDLSEVLTAQNNHLSAKISLNNALLQKQLAVINLYIALGGGWQPSSHS